MAELTDEDINKIWDILDAQAGSVPVLAARLWMIREDAKTAWRAEFKKKSINQATKADSRG